MRIELELAASTKAVWHEVQLNLDRTPPVLTFNNPAVANSVTTVVKPYLQIQGSANKDLASLSYDINNANGVFTDQDVSVVDRSLDTNTMDFSTNTFQAYDVPLAVGDNHITLHMSDRAGNTTTTNFNAVLDYSAATTPPVVSLTWPTDGMKVSGNNITIRGKMSDETGTIAAQVDNGDGTFTTIPGVVERDHTFWIENVPFNGTSPISIQATDAAGLATGAVGHVTTTSLNISPSTVTLTINGWPGTGDLWKSSGYVSGTVSGPAATVTVNGWPVTVVNGTSWSAVDYGVPIYGEGTATFDAVAYDADGNPIANASAAIEKDSYYAIVNYTCNETYDQVSTDNTFLPDHTTSFKNYSVQTSLGTGGPWHLGYTGSWNVPYLSKNGGGATTGDYNWNWSDSNPLSRYDFDSEWLYNEVLSVPSVDYIDPESRQQIWVSHYYADDNVNYTWTAPHTLTSISAQARTVAKLYTGGKAVVGRQSLFCITAGATEYLDPPGNSDGFGWYSYFKDMWAYTPTAPVANSRLKVGGKQVGADGNLWIVLPENSEQTFPVTVDGAHHYDAWITKQKYKLAIKANSSVTLDPDVVVDGATTFCVGQHMHFSTEFNPALPENPEITAIKWTFTGTHVNDHSQANSQGSDNWFMNPNKLTSPSVDEWWIAGTDPAQAKSQLKAVFGEGLTFANGQYVIVTSKGLFNMYRPHFVGIVNQSSAEVKVVESRLGVGDGTAATGSGDMQFDVQVQTSVEGVANCLQLIQRDGSYDTTIFTSQCFSTGGLHWLDNNQTIAARYLNPLYPQFIPHYYDSPSLSGMYSTVSLSDDFEIYVQFAPTSSGKVYDIGDSIFVTLGIIKWSWAGNAHNVMMSGHWFVFGIPYISTITTQQSSAFPTWTQILTTPNSYHLCY